MAAFMALAAIEHLGHKQDAVAEVLADDIHAGHQPWVSTS